MRAHWVAGALWVLFAVSPAMAGPNVKKSTWGTYAAQVVVRGASGQIAAGSQPFPEYECPAGQVPLLVALSAVVGEVGTADDGGGFSANQALPDWTAWTVTLDTGPANVPLILRGSGSDTPEIRLDGGYPLTRNALLIANLRRLPQGATGALVLVYATVACGTPGLQPR